MTNFTSFNETQMAISSGSTNCVEITRSYLDAIAKNKHLNAFVEVFEEEALIRASEIDNKIRLGTGGKLAGMVIGIKDNIC